MHTSSYISRRILTLLGTVGISLSLVMYRIVLTHDDYFLFLFWNFFLAIIPLAIGRIIAEYHTWLPAYGTTVLFMIWLLFLPNAAYLITDLLHVFERAGAPGWFDLLLFFSCAWSGLLITYASLHDVSFWLTSKLKNRHYHTTIMISILFLTALGVYLGRFIRWNSWDIIVHPWNFIVTNIDIFSRYSVWSDMVWFTLTWGIFLTIGWLHMRENNPIDTQKKKRSARNTKPATRRSSRRKTRRGILPVA